MGNGKRYRTDRAEDVDYEDEDDWGVVLRVK